MNLFNFSSKKKKLQSVNDQIFTGMLNCADETEKSYRNFIKDCVEFNPKDKFHISDYGIYKARLITCLLIACGGHYKKHSLGLIDSKDLLNEVQLATGIAYKPFQDSATNNYLDFDNLSQKTEKLVVYFLKNLMDDIEEIQNSEISHTKPYFDNILKLFKNAISESVENKETMEKILISENFYFQHLTRLNLKLMKEYMSY